MWTIIMIFWVNNFKYLEKNLILYISIHIFSVLQISEKMHGNIWIDKMNFIKFILLKLIAEDVNNLVFQVSYFKSPFLECSCSLHHFFFLIFTSSCEKRYRIQLLLQYLKSLEFIEFLWMVISE